MAETIPTGPESLQAWLTEERRTQMWLAGQIGVSQTAVSSWLRGARPPPLATALAIQRLTGIPVESWAEPAASASTPDVAPSREVGS